MSGITKEELEETLVKAMKPRHAYVDEKIHKSHHDYVELLLEKKAKNAKRVERFSQSLIGTAATGVAALFIWIGKLVIDAFRHGS